MRAEDAARVAAEVRALVPPGASVAPQVAEIIAAVRAGGDAALEEYEARFAVGRAGGEPAGGGARGGAEPARAEPAPGGGGEPAPGGAPPPHNGGAPPPRGARGRSLGPPLRMPDAALEIALDGLDPDVRAGLETAIANVRAVAEAGLDGERGVMLPEGQTVTLRELPVRRA
ncbi:MAG TPA: hypothetical protein VFG79_17680, partial [Solirubrobacter sp.]|nr:hypothetical protein [Solirubrobacter sp.]